MYTQITAPCEIEKKKMKPTSSQTRSDWWALAEKMVATPAREIAVPTEPMSRSDLRPSLSMTDMARIVAQKIHGAEQHGLLVAGERGEAGESEDIVGVVKNGVDAGELIEHADGDGQENRQAVLALEERLGFGDALEMDGVDDFFELSLGVGGAHHLQNLAGFVNAILSDEPARAARDSKEKKREERGRNGGDAELPAPCVGAC